MGMESHSGASLAEQNWKKPDNSESQPAAPERVEIGNFRLDYGVDTRASADHPGHNEDGWAAKEGERSGGKSFSVAVFDGIGGSAGGQRASEAAVRGFMSGIGERKSSGYPLIDSVRGATIEVYDDLIKDDLKGSGCTMAAVEIYQGENGLSLEIANVGDSRIYLLREGQLYKLSKDNDRIQGDVDKGILTQDRADEIGDILDKYDGSQTLDEQTMQYWQGRNGITDGLSIHVNPDTKDFSKSHKSFELAVDDLVLLTSDGVHDNLTKAEIADILNRTQGLSSEQAAKELIEASYQRSLEGKQINIRSKQDDITAQVIKIDSINSVLNQVNESGNVENVGRGNSVANNEMAESDAEKPSRWGKVAGLVKGIFSRANDERVAHSISQAASQEPLKIRHEESRVSVDGYRLSGEVRTKDIFNLLDGATSIEVMVDMLDANGEKNLHKNVGGNEQRQSLGEVSNLIRRYQNGETGALDLILSNTVRGKVKELLPSRVESVDESKFRLKEGNSHQQALELFSSANNVDTLIEMFNANRDKGTRKGGRFQTYGEIADLTKRYVAGEFSALDQIISDSVKGVIRELVFAEKDPYAIENSSTEKIFGLLNSAKSIDELIKMMNANSTQGLSNTRGTQTLGEMSALIGQYKNFVEGQRAGHTASNADYEAFDKIISSQVRKKVQELLPLGDGQFIA
ncbi:MAG: protein phosphatase 2C domain-containing protein [Pseudomonadales bacterium]|jgi:protein phosphatase|nr:protein phosphatase 2C domain-containing protein [Pseudomonadales bacterium]